MAETMIKERVMVNVNKIMEYENGSLDDQEVLDLFQELVNDGTVWTLQGSYGRMAAALINAGLIVDPNGH